MDEEEKHKIPVTTPDDAPIPEEQVVEDVSEFKPPETEQPPQPISFEPPKKPKRFSGKRLVFAAVGLIVLAGIGFGVAVLTEDKDGESEATTGEAQQTTTQNTSEVIDDVLDSSATKTYKSDNPRVEFTYPETWTITANTETEGIRVESPEFSYTTVNGGNVTGHFRVYIRQGARSVDSEYIGRGIASQDSETLAYTEPAVGQREETNLSFFGLDSADHFAFYMIAGNFSLKKGESLGPEYGREPDTYIIAGGYSSKELTDDLATNPVTLEYFSQTNAYKQGMTIIKSLKLL